MHKDTTWTIGFARKTARHKSIAEQDRQLRGAGAIRIITSLPALYRAVRKGAGDVVVVQCAYLLADPDHGRSQGGARTSLRAVLDELRKRGAAVHDLETGVRASTADEYLRLERAGTDALSRTRAGARKIGRPAVEIPVDKQAAVRAIWHNTVAYRTDNDARLAIAQQHGIAISVSGLIRRFERSGRGARKQR